jgi:hypothetical protein
MFSIVEREDGNVVTDGCIVERAPGVLARQWYRRHGWSSPRLLF